jgi:hypothetical protein
MGMQVNQAGDYQFATVTEKGQSGVLLGQTGENPGGFSVNTN